MINAVKVRVGNEDKHNVAQELHDATEHIERRDHPHEQE